MGEELLGAVGSWALVAAMGWAPGTAGVVTLVVAMGWLVVMFCLSIAFFHVSDTPVIVIWGGEVLVK